MRRWLNLFNEVVMKMLGQGILETLYMTIASTVFAYILGLPAGIVLVVTDKTGIRPNAAVNRVLGTIVNLLRSIPFIILLILLIPFTRLVVGTSIGTNATVVPLIIAAAPFVARLVESSLKEVDNGVIEAAQSMGASTMQIILKVMLPEAKPSLLVGSAIASTTILSYSVMAGFTGGGGLGSIAVTYGYYRYQTGIMVATVVLLVIIVQILQDAGMKLTKKTDKRL